MITIINKYLRISFYLLLSLVPLVLFHKTSELFEFNKMIVTYLFTVIIIFLWIMKMIASKKVIFKKTIVDIPLILFLLGQILATVVSIDTRTSILGYYSRFHGGLLSSFSYAFLYWAYVSNIDKAGVIKSIYSLFISAFFISFYAVLEHFGIDKDIWIQDVQNRVFSTLGQPNWLAAWIVTLIPVGWAFAITAKKQKFRSYKIPYWVWLGLSSLFFLTLIYTKSRSGILGFAVLEAIFWPTVFVLSLKKKAKLKNIIKKFLIIHLIIGVIISFTGTPWTPSVDKLFIREEKPQVEVEVKEKKPQRPALEAERYDSRKIRRIVWQGAADIWKNYPVVGSGVETFAYSYYQFRPLEHNLVSEWDFLYNKAHNEYLNFLSTTGTIGTGMYAIFVGFALFLFVKKSKVIRALLNLRKKSRKVFASGINNYLATAFLSGFASILVTNFFGFSVVPVAIQFFLFPAFAVALVRESDKVKEPERKEFSSSQKSGIIIISSLALLLLYSIGKYWYTDYVYAQGKAYSDIGNFLKSREYLSSAVKLSPNEAIYWDELAQTNAHIAVALIQEGNTELANQLAASATKETEKAVSLSPANVNLKRTQASIFINLSSINPNYLILAKNTLEQATKNAPTEAKLLYNLGLTYAKLGDTQKAKEIFQKTIEMKNNYRNPYFGMGIIYMDEGENELAREQFEYILTNISAEDTEAQRYLDELNN